MDGIVCGFGLLYSLSRCVYLLCIQKGSQVNARAIYARYEEAMKDCIVLSVLPLLEGKQDVAMLATLMQILSSYKLMASRLYKVFVYVDRYFTPHARVPPLSSASVRCFHDIVSKKFSNEFQAAAIALINRERNGDKVDRDLLKAAVELFVEAKSVGATCYDDFEKAVLADAAAYYFQMASYGLQNYSYADYITKACMSIHVENEMACHFLDPSMRLKLLQVARTLLLDRVSVNLREKQLAENNVMTNQNQELPIAPELENCLSALMMRAVNISTEP
ncbi:hypothetical protein Dimus_012189 [Dionaea muscipula]